MLSNAFCCTAVLLSRSPRSFSAGMFVSELKPSTVASIACTSVAISQITPGGGGTVVCVNVVQEEAKEEGRAGERERERERERNTQMMFKQGCC